MMNEVVRTGYQPATPFVRRFGTLAMSIVIGLGMFTPVSTFAGTPVPHTDLPAPVMIQGRAVNTSYPQMPAPEVKASLSADDPTTGYLDVSWEAVPDAEKYQIILFNGAYHSYWDVLTTETSWTTKGKGMFPTNDEILAGAIDFRRDGKGTEFWATPGPLYEKAFELKGGTDYSATNNYYVRVTAVHHDGARPISPAAKGHIPAMEPEVIENPDTVEDLMGLIETEKGQLAPDEVEEIAAYEESVSYLEELDSRREVDEEMLEEVHDLMLEAATVEPFDTEPLTDATISPHVGRIIYMTWNSSYRVYHGHVGIGSSKPVNFIEANPNDGVAVYTNRIKFWKDLSDRLGQKRPILLEVKNTSQNTRLKAERYARSHIDKPYSVWPGWGTGSFYCSELVFRSWLYAGRDIGSPMSSYWNGGYVWPYHIYIDADTRAVKLP